MNDIFVIVFLTFLEGLLSFDNAVVLAVLVNHLPQAERKRALTYGMIGAFVFRAIALAFATTIMSYHWVKLLGGAYLIYLAVANWLAPHDDTQPKTHSSFWGTVLKVELMDAIFSIDSILAAASISQKYMVVLIGGITGIIMMRFAATIFTKLIDKFPALNGTAYQLVALIGAKLVLEFGGVDFQSNDSPFTYLFWAGMVSIAALGFNRKTCGATNG